MTSDTGRASIIKDALLEPVKYAAGPWNFADALPTHLLGLFKLIREVGDPAGV